jgi:molybdate-binding protein
MTQPSNHNHVHSLAGEQKGAVLVNWEQGSGAESLLDQKLTEAGISTHQLNGYERIVGSRLEVARRSPFSGSPV